MSTQQSALRGEKLPFSPEEVLKLMPGLRTKADVYKLPNEDLTRLMKTEEGLAAINAALNATPDNPVVTPEEITAKEQVAKEAAEKAAVDAVSAEAARVVAEQEAVKKAAETVPKPWETEDAKYKEIFERLGVIVTRDDQGNITKVVQNFQVKDEAGKPVGRPTRFETSDLGGLLLKNNESYTQAVRAFDRLKTQKVSFKNQAEIPISKPLTDEEMAQAIKDLKSSDEAKAIAAARKISGSEVAKAELKAHEAEVQAQGKATAYDFMKHHIHDFNPCQANSDIIGKYLEDNQLEYTVDNLELAFLAKENELAPVIPKEPVRPTPPVVNPLPASEVSASKMRKVVITKGEAYPTPEPGETLLIIEKEPVVVPAPPAVPATPAPPAVPVNPELPASRPGVNGGIAPGSLSGTKPVISTGKLTKAAILEMAKKEPAKFKRMIADPKSRTEMNAILAGRA